LEIYVWIIMSPLLPWIVCRFRGGEPKTRRDDEVKGDDFVECEGSVEGGEG
jgi:hypothetical protein